MSKLKKLDIQVSNAIRYNQVITGICSTVKELIENSLDANANQIQIKLKNYGLDYIEVNDNGDGIEIMNHEYFTMKNYTSKLTNFEDIYLIKTFGFRGEAISSICSLSSLRCITRYKNNDLANDIIYDKFGKIIKSQIVARDIGTTIVVSDIFLGIPVRRKELEKNIKQEYNKLIRLIEAYSLLFSSCSFSLLNIIKNTNVILILMCNYILIRI